MPEDKERLFTEAEAYAIAADRVASETAALTAEVARLKSEQDTLQNTLDVEIAAKEAAELATKEATKALDDFKESIESEKAALAKRDERLSQMKEAAKHLTDEFFADEGRVKRIVAMSDEDFEGYKADLAKVSVAGPHVRETAMENERKQTFSTGDTKATAVKSLLQYRFSSEKAG